MNSEIAMYPTADDYPSFEVTVGAPLCDLMRRYSDATEAVHAFEQSAHGYPEFGGDLDSACGFVIAEHSRHIDLQLAVA